MKIEHAGLLVVPQNSLQIPFEQHVWEQPEIAAAASRPVGAQSSHRRDRYLDELAVLERVKREARLLRYPIEIVPDRDRTGAVAIARILKSVERPQIFARDGKRGCPVSLNRHAT